MRRIDAPSGHLRDRLRRRSLWLLVGFSLFACASADRPVVTLASVKLAGLSLFEQRFMTTLRVQNHSSAYLALQGVSVEVELGGTTFARGVSPTSLVLPAYGQDTIRVETVSTTSDLVRQLRDLAKGGDLKVKYRLKGRLQPRDRSDAIPFNDKGVISLTDLSLDR
jgi:LEA14-like dessication related protein